MRVLEGGNGKKNTARRRRRRVKIGILVAGSFVLLILCAFLYILTVYRVKTVVVEGNVHRTDEEIQREVMKGRLGSNSLYLSMKYKNRQISRTALRGKLSTTNPQRSRTNKAATVYPESTMPIISLHA